MCACILTVYVCACPRAYVNFLCVLAACRLMRQLEEPEPRPEQMEMGSLFRLIHRYFSLKGFVVTFVNNCLSSLRTK